MHPTLIFVFWSCKTEGENPAWSPVPAEDKAAGGVERTEVDQGMCTLAGGEHPRAAQQSLGRAAGCRVLGGHTHLTKLCSGSGPHGEFRPVFSRLLWCWGTRREMGPC